MTTDRDQPVTAISDEDRAIIVRRTHMLIEMGNRDEAAYGKEVLAIDARLTAAEAERDSLRERDSWRDAIMLAIRKALGATPGDGQSLITVAERVVAERDQARIERDIEIGHRLITQEDVASAESQRDQARARAEALTAALTEIAGRSGLGLYGCADIAQRALGVVSVIPTR